MKVDRLVPVMVGVLGFLNPAFGDYVTSASFSVLGDVVASGVNADGSPDYVDVPIRGTGFQTDFTGGPAIELYYNDFDASTNNGVAHAHADVTLTSRAGFGVLGVTAAGAVNASGAGYPTAVASIRTLDVDAMFTDQLVVTAKGLSRGSPLLVKGALLLHGSLSGSVTGPSDPNDSAAADYSLYFSLGHTTGAPPPPGDGAYYGFVSGNTDFTVGLNQQPQDFIVTNIEAESGVPTPLTVELEVTVGLGNIEAGVGRRIQPNSITLASTFNAAYGNTLRWGGITSVTDLSTGLPVDDWTITSASGTD